MHVLVAGAHGQVGQHVTAFLIERGYGVRAMVRDGAQTSQLEASGAETVVADLKGDVSSAVKGCGAVIFAAGSSGKDVEGVDRDGAIKLIALAERQGADRFVMLSSMAADDPERGAQALRPYLKAKGEADARLQASDLTYTIVRPGRLTDDPATGKVRIARRFDGWGTISRQDVARALVSALDLPSTHGQTFEVLEGDEPIEDALRAVSS